MPWVINPVTGEWQWEGGGQPTSPNPGSQAPPTYGTPKPGARPRGGKPLGGYKPAPDPNPLEPPIRIVPPPVIPQPGAVNSISGPDATVQIDGGLPIIYGVQRVDGQLFFSTTGDTNSATFAYAIGVGPISSMDKIFINGRDCTAYSLVTTTLYSGTYTQSVDSWLSAAGYSTRLPGVAWVKIVVSTPGSQQTWRDAFPEKGIVSVVFEISGLKVLDPGNLGNPKAYSANPAWCLYDFLTDTVHGCGVPTALVDATNFDTAGDYCDETVNSEARFKINATFGQQTTGDSILQQMLIACNGDVYMEGGKYKLFIDKPQTSVVLALNTTTNCREVEYAPVSSRDVPTRVIVQYRNAAKRYATDTVTAEHPGLAAGTVELRESRYNLETVTSEKQASRIAYYLQNRALTNLQVNLVASFSGVLLSRGSLISLTSGEGLAAQQFVVTSYSRELSGEYRISAIQYEDSVYDETAITPDTPPDTVLPDVTAPGTTFAGHLDNNPGQATEYRGLIFWDAPRTGYTTITTSSGWFSATGYDTFDATKVNDGNTAVACLTASGALVQATLNIDTGSGNEKRCGRIKIASNHATGAPFQISFSDDNATWIWAHKFYYVPTYSAPYHIWELVTGGAHRYWRIYYESVLSLSIYEVTLEAPVDNTQVDHYDIYRKDGTAGGYAYFATTPTTYTSATPYVAPDLVISTGLNTPGGLVQYIGFGVQAVTWNGIWGPTPDVDSDNGWADGYTSFSRGYRTSLTVTASASASETLFYQPTTAVGAVKVFGPNATTRGKFYVQLAESDGGNALDALVINTDGDVGIGATGPGATSSGRRFVTLKGSTGAGVIETETAESDADDVLVGLVQGTDINSTSTDKRVASMQFYLSGTTANKRGGKIYLRTKPNNANDLVTRVVVQQDGSVDADAQPRVLAWQASGTSCTSDAFTDILFDTNSSVTGENTRSDYPMHSTTTNTDRFCAPVAGFYFYRFGAVFTTGAAGTLFELRVVNQSSTVLATSMIVIPAHVSNGWGQISGVCQMAAADYIKLSIYNHDGSNAHTTTTGRGNTEGQLAKIW